MAPGRSTTSARRVTARRPGLDCALPPRCALHSDDGSARTLRGRAHGRAGGRPGVRADAALERLATGAAAAGGAFPDGAHFRIEIPSVEGPRVLEEVVRAADAEGIVVNRV